MSDEQRFVVDRYYGESFVMPCVRDTSLGKCAVWPQGSDERLEDIAASLNADPTLSFNFQWRRYE